jgi:predicted aldo/keto reductase-like oxidoreductase
MIRYAGFSFHGMREDFKRIVDSYDWDFCQIQYNLLDTENQAGTEGLEYAASKGLGIIVMEPLRGGNLAGRVPDKVRSIWSRAQVTRTPAEWALRWIWNRPEVSVVLSGMTYDSHLEENLRVVEDALPGSLSEPELSLVGEAASAYRSLMKAGCTGCQYCMPCPAGVNIPAVFEYYNGSSLFGNRLKTFVNYGINLGGILGAKPSGASLCIRCGTCLKACPQHLPIPDLLEQARKQFEGPLGKSLVGLAKLGLGLQAFLSRLTRPRAG